MRARLRVLALVLLPILVFSTAWAAAAAQISIDVIHGTKAGVALDRGAAKHKAVLDRMPQWTQWVFVETLAFEAPIAQVVDRSTAGRRVQVTVQALTGDKATTKVEVVGPTGKKNGLTSSLKRGASMVVVEQSADAAEVYVFVVTVHY